MRCEHVQERALESLLAGAEMPQGIQPHLAECRECAAEVSRLRAGTRAVQLLRGASLAPPPEVKARVFDAIAKGASATEPCRARQAAAPWMRTLLRPVPVAAAALLTLFVVGTLTVVAQRSKVAETNKLVGSIPPSGVLGALDQLESAPWVADAVGGLIAVKAAKLQLQRAAAAKNDWRTVYEVRSAITQQHLAETFRGLEHVAPEDQRSLVSRVRLKLEEIQAAQP